MLRMVNRKKPLRGRSGLAGGVGVLTLVLFSRNLNPLYSDAALDHKYMFGPPRPPLPHL